MDASKITTVKLVVPQHNMEQEFGIVQAERLLRMPNNGGWQLPKDSEFVFDFNNGIGRKPVRQSYSGTKK